MISKSVNKRNDRVNDDPLFILAELLIKIDKRANVIKIEEGSNENKRNSDNTSQTK